MEYQFSLDQLFPAYEQLKQSIELAAENKCVFVASPIQIRFTARSTRSLMTHLTHQPTVSLSIAFFREHEGAHTWLPELERRLLDCGGKPHWGKMYYTVPQPTAESGAFEEIRARLDPDGLFGFEQGPYFPDADAFQQ